MLKVVIFIRFQIKFDIPKNKPLYTSIPIAFNNPLKAIQSYIGKIYILIGNQNLFRILGAPIIFSPTKLGS